MSVRYRNEKNADGIISPVGIASSTVLRCWKAKNSAILYGQDIDSEPSSATLHEQAPQREERIRKNIKDGVHIESESYDRMGE
jgi:hypothetical protein